MTGHANLIREALDAAADPDFGSDTETPDLLRKLADALKTTERMLRDEATWARRQRDRAEAAEKERDQALAQLGLAEEGITALEEQESRSDTQCVCYRRLDTPEQPGAASQVTGP